MITDWIRKPLFWFVAQSLGLALALAMMGDFQPVRVPDTASYEEFRFGAPAESLRQMRTFGYPLLLDLGALFASSHKAVPALGYMLHVLGVFVFWQGLKRVIRSDWTSMVVASSLLYSNIVFRYGNNLATDSVGSSLAIATIGWLLLTILGRPHRVFWWVLALSVFVTYQVRPAYLFLIPLIPLLGIALHWLVTSDAAPRRERRMLTLKLSAAVLLPFLAFCAVRWLAVGQFSLVSFGGNNIAGVVSFFIDADDVDDLPPHIRPLATAVVRRREAVAATDPEFAPPTTLGYMGIEGSWDINTAGVCVPAAREVYGNDWGDIDRGLWQLALAVVVKKPLYYGVWLAKAFVRGVYMIVSEYIMNPVYLALIFGMVGCQARYVVLRKSCQRGATVTAPTVVTDFASAVFIELNALWLIAVSFALSKLLLVILTSPPQGRFMDAAGVFLACVLVRALVYRIELCRHWKRGAGTSAIACRECP